MPERMPRLRWFALAGLTATTAAVAAIALTSSDPPLATGATFVHEAETFTYGVVDPVDGTVWPKLVSEPDASGGQALRFGPNGTSAKAVPTTEDITEVVIRARGQMCQGPPVATVRIDGVQAAAIPVAATVFTEYRQPVAVPAGDHEVTVAFENNFNQGCSNGGRDLYFDRLALTDEAAPPPTPTPSPTVTPTPDPPPPMDGTVWWRGDPAAGRSQWRREHMVSSSRATDAGVFEGRRAWRMQINDGDNFGGYGERTEFGQDGAPACTTPSCGSSQRTYRPSADAWWGYSVWMPSGFPTNVSWSAFSQWKDQNPDLGSPSWETYVSRGRLGIYKHIGGAGFVWDTPATTGVWHNFVVHMRFSASSSGLLETWHSTGDVPPARVYSANRQTYRSPATITPRLGYYRDRAIPGNAAVYHAGYAVGSSFGAVNPVP